MDAEAIVAVSASVVALTQILKWANAIPDRFGPLSVLLLSLVGVALWGYSRGDFERTKVFGYFAGWVAVSLGAAGVYGFTRAGAEAVTKATAPPATGAGSEKTK